MLVLLGKPEKSSHFKKFLAPRVLHRFELFKLQLKAESLKYFCDFSRCLASTKNVRNFNLKKFHGCKLAK